jgi:hypothetical protein
MRRWRTADEGERWIVCCVVPIFATLLGVCIALLALSCCESAARGQELKIGAVVSHSESAGYDGPVAGIELIADVKVLLRLEGSVHYIDKFDGGNGVAYRGLAGVHLPRSFMIGVQVAGMNTEHYERTDFWLVVDWAFLRAELERETWRVEARPTFELFRHGYVRPALGYTSGRGSSGVVLSVAAGARW